MKRTLAALLSLLLLSGCGIGGSDKGDDQGESPSPAQVERVEGEEASEGGEQASQEPKAPEQAPLEQPNLTAEEAQILLVPDEAGIVPIHTPEDLIALSALVGSGDETHREMTFQLQKNISLSGIDFIPIGGMPAAGEGRTAFNGVFDGGNFQISGLTIRDNGNVLGTGLFGCIGPEGSVQDLHVVSGNVTGGDQGGAVGGLAGMVEGSLSNCSYSGVVVSDGIGVGGLAGSLETTGGGPGKGTIEACFANADVTGAGNVGGFVGLTIVGTAITDCYALGEVNAVDGGEGEVTGVGGFAGAGGGEIARCFSNNEVYTYTTAYNVGGFAGTGGDDTFSGCYYNQTATENWRPIGSQGSGDEAAEPGVTGCTVAQLVERETYVGWDFESVWDIDGQHNRGLPFLRAAQLA